MCNLYHLVQILCSFNTIVIVYIGSLELISKVAAHVNESIRQVDNFKKLLDVQKKLVGDTGNSLISPSRVSNTRCSTIDVMLSASLLILYRNYYEKESC